MSFPFAFTSDSVLWSPAWIVVSGLFIAVWLWMKSLRPKNCPPGPAALPFLGNLLSFGKQPHIAMLQWKEKYGDIYTIFDGRKRMVVLSDFNTVRKVFADDAAAGRDHDSAIRIDDSTFARIGLIFSEGDLWKTHRRFAVSSLRDLGMGKNWLEDTIVTEVEELCGLLRETNQQPFNPKVQLTNSISNVICALIFGKRFDLHDPEFSRVTRFIAEYVESTAFDPIAQALPFLMWFPNGIRQIILRARLNFVSLADFLRERVKEHDVSVARQADGNDYLYAYQTEREKRSKTGTQNTFDDTQLMASLADLFEAGTETTSTTTLWAFVFMVENPDVMRKIQEEIDSNCGRDRMLINTDRSRLPYTEAAILEFQRCASLVPLGVPHRAKETMSVDGYTIPKDTIIVANLFSIHRDPRWWVNPDKFHPHRFLDENMKLTRPDGFAPFSIGKRACLGEALAKMELFLFIANLLRCFTLKVPVGKTVSHEDYASSIVNCPNSFELIFIPRTD